MPNSDLLPSLLFKLNENQLALEAAIMELSKWVEQRGSAEVTDNIRGLTLFCSPRGGKPVHYSSVKDAFKRNCSAAGLAGATLHDLRAKSLTDTDKQGNNAQKLGGHTDAKMTARYLRLREVDIAEPPRLPKTVKS